MLNGRYTASCEEISLPCNDLSAQPISRNHLRRTGVQCGGRSVKNLGQSVDNLMLQQHCWLQGCQLQRELLDNFYSCQILSCITCITCKRQNAQHDLFRVAQIFLFCADSNVCTGSSSHPPIPSSHFNFPNFPPASASASACQWQKQHYRNTFFRMCIFWPGFSHVTNCDILAMKHLE